MDWFKSVHDNDDDDDNGDDLQHLNHLDDSVNEYKGEEYKEEYKGESFWDNERSSPRSSPRSASSSHSALSFNQRHTSTQSMNTICILNNVHNKLYQTAQQQFKAKEDPVEDPICGITEHGLTNNQTTNEQLSTMDKWYLEQDRSSKPPYKEFTNQFTFLMIKGQTANIHNREEEEEEEKEEEGKGEGRKERDEEEEEVIEEHHGDSIREEVKKILVKTLLDTMLGGGGGEGGGRRRGGGRKRER